MLINTYGKEGKQNNNIQEENSAHLYLKGGQL